MLLSPQTKSLLEMTYRVGAPRFHELSTNQARHSFQKLQFAFRPDAPAVASTVEVPMGRRDGSVLLGRLYRPINSSPEDTLPLLIYFHGGGWCVGDIASYDVFCRELANAAGGAVLSVEYRLAPESPFPAAVNDADFALEWAIQNACDLEVDPGRVAVGGDSAGGNLAIVTALTHRNRGLRDVKFLLLIYPSTVIRSERPSRLQFGDGYFLDRTTLDWFYTRYLGGNAAEDWRLSPLLAESFVEFPPMLLITAECDPLTDDCLAFADRVEAEGGLVTRWQAEGVVHGFVTLGKLFPEASEAIAVAARALRGAWGDSQGNWR